MFGAETFAGGEVPVEHADPRAAGRQRQSLLALPQGLLGPSALFDFSGKLPIGHHEFFGTLLHPAFEFVVGLLQPLFHPPVLRKMMPFAQGPANNLGHVGQSGLRLDHIVQRPASHGLNGGPLVALAGHHHDRESGLLSCLGENIQAAAVRKAEIGNNQIGTGPRRAVTRFRQGAHHAQPHPIVPGLECPPNQFGMRLFVLDQQNLRSLAVHDCSNPFVAAGRPAPASPYSGGFWFQASQ